MIPRKWHSVGRILDKQSYTVVPDAGIILTSHGYVANFAQAVLLAADKPGDSTGQVYNCGDEALLTLHQVLEVDANKRRSWFVGMCTPI